ncbi:mechanosensitive ion channel family protein [Natrarchaeobaculum sulfurireducens]|uniref:Putative mechanosensitive channel n=1 Tax=Natrarchaeobaculum sulfurireducens TaxID=2044521 RepID=A0A346PEX4_9EURY|nr:mechanosensitive ion channel family protein [Natrarchaeobaculum sulfurireducens]AXR78069.1 Small-conductance mechanosensitive channel [Natrarchaeobaculum sulfurireducens]AXR81942.1 putative mechanosensitive channel [Natrarchaeobaculum sulfurireducens]
MRPVFQLNGPDAVEDVEGTLPGPVPDYAVEIGLAVVVLVVGWYLSKLAVRLTGRSVARRIERPSVTRTVLRGVRLSVLLLTVVTVASILGVSGTEILLSVTVISAVIAVVLAPLVGSFINGVFVLADRPYEIGDMIEITDEGHKGFVEDITIRYTKIFTLQNTFIVIPNAEIQQRDVINYSAEDERTRIAVSFEITYDSDLESACQTAERAARGVENVISGGPDIRIGSARYAAAPRCVINEYADNGIVLELYVWLKHPYRQAVDRSMVQQAVRDRFTDLDVEFAYPHRHHVFDETSGVARMTVDDVGPDGQFIDPAAQHGEDSPGSGEQ